MNDSSGVTMRCLSLVVKQNRFNTLQLLNANSARAFWTHSYRPMCFGNDHKATMIKMHGGHLEFDGGALMNQTSRYVSRVVGWTY